jgi:hypothetical protein
MCFSTSLTTAHSTFHPVLATNVQSLISNFHIVLNVVCFLLGNSPAYEVYMPTFRNTIYSIFISGVSRKNNRDETATVFIQVKVWFSPKKEYKRQNRWLYFCCFFFFGGGGLPLICFPLLTNSGKCRQILLKISQH